MLNMDVHKIDQAVTPPPHKTVSKFFPQKTEPKEESVDDYFEFSQNTPVQSPPPPSKKYVYVSILSLVTLSRMFILLNFIL